MSSKQFHQFVIIEKGPVKSAVINFLDRTVFQVENKIIETFEKGKYEEIPEFIQALEEEGLLIDVEEGAFIPNPLVEREDFNKHKDAILVEVEEGADLDLIKKNLQTYEISEIFYYGESPDVEIIAGVSVTLKKKDFKRCMRVAASKNEFLQCDEMMYSRNKKYHPCWGTKAAITADMKVRPCIYSEIEAGDMKKESFPVILENLKQYWYLTKDKVKKCGACELRFVCFDCREVAHRVGNDLHAPEPACRYDPYTGNFK